MGKPSIEFAYSGIRVKSITRSLRFYRALGFRVRKRGRMEHGGIWVQLEIPGQPQRLELNHYPRRTRFFETYRSGSELDHLGFRVRDVDEWTRRAIRAGGRLAVEFSETAERLAYVRDPNGVWVEFFGPVAPPKNQSP